MFVAAGATLLFVQNLVVQQLFSGAIDVTMSVCSVEGESGSFSQEVPAPPPGEILYSDNVLTGCQFVVDHPQEAVGAGTAGAVIQQSKFLVDVVSSGLLFWSVIVLLVFTGAAAALAYWLAKRSLGRIAEVTSAAQNISEHALDRRLGLPGPDDEIKELGDTFDGMLDRLQLAFAAQDRFVANASHELRTPLTVMRTALEIPLEQGDVPKRLEPGAASCAAGDRPERAPHLCAARAREVAHRAHRLRPDRPG